MRERLRNTAACVPRSSLPRQPIHFNWLQTTLLPVLVLVDEQRELVQIVEPDVTPAKGTLVHFTDDLGQPPSS